MSSSSVISRVTRSASASMVSIMSRFCSSVNRSHRRSRVVEKPLTEVSGERSSWATVEISAALVALGPLAGLGVAQADDDRGRPAGCGPAGRSAR